MTPQDLVMALSAALAVLRGEGGGYSPTEKNKAIEILASLRAQTLKEIGD